MQHHLTIERTGYGWQVQGLPRDPACLYAELADALSFAQRACAAEAAVIKFFVDGQYIVTAVQEQGWPLTRCRPAVPSTADDSGPASSRRSLFRLWNRLVPAAGR